MKVNEEYVQILNTTKDFTDDKEGQYGHIDDMDVLSYEHHHKDGHNRTHYSEESDGSQLTK